MRIPAQNALLADPTVITVDPAGSKAHTGRGIRTSGSSHSSLIVSSAISTVPAERAASTSRRRWSSSASAPVGLWKSATTYAIRGAASRRTCRQRSMSQPVSPSAIATGTSRAPASRMSWRMLAYEGDSTAMRSPRPANRWQIASIAPIAPVVTMICSGMVGIPRSVYRSAIIARSAGSPAG